MDKWDYKLKCHKQEVHTNPFNHHNGIVTFNQNLKDW